ncbi:hypothetical protein HMSSN139_23690 [Paenibacillus sp. HMSSN-139]|nr:hypothetical protein HMSSN139_23690 [Paenibacillus sp. HMSSN-139]
MVEAMEAKRIGLAVAARLLGYPDDSYPEVLKETVDAVSDVEDCALKNRLEAAIRPLESLPLRELREQYVWTFDWKEKTGLYLTAHELGDSRERGAALILLQHIIGDAGLRRRPANWPTICRCCTSCWPFVRTMFTSGRSSCGWPWRRNAWLDIWRRTALTVNCSPT